MSAIKRNTVYIMPAVDLLRAIPSRSVGAIISDPPFFIGVGRPPSGGEVLDPWVAMDNIDAMIEYYAPVARETFRVLRAGGACVMMGGSRSIAAWEVAASRAGLCWMAELTVLWNTGKPRANKFGSLTTTIRWYAKPGARHAFNADGVRAIYSNVLVATKVSITDRVHPAQKPVELTNFLISLLTMHDDLVVDPYCGSGSTLVSAAICDRPWVGGDQDPSYADIAMKRALQWQLEETDLNSLYLWINGRLTEVSG